MRAANTMIHFIFRRRVGDDLILDQAKNTIVRELMNFETQTVAFYTRFRENFTTHTKLYL